MSLHRGPVAFLFLLTLAASAAGDVIILKGNDTPLSGTILSESETSVRFRIRGLSDGSFVEISRERIKASWRDAPEAVLQERSDRALTPPRPPAATAPSTPPTTAPAAPRSPDQVREGNLEILRDRLRALTPGGTTAGALTIVIGIGFGVVLLWVGGRLADMDELGLPQAALMSLLTVAFCAAGPFVYDVLPDDRSRAAALVGAIALWILFVRVTIHESVRKAILLFSFFVLGTGLVGLIGFSILSVV